MPDGFIIPNPSAIRLDEASNSRTAPARLVADNFGSGPNGAGNLTVRWRLIQVPEVAGGDAFFFRKNPAEIAWIVKAHRVGNFGNA